MTSRPRAGGSGRFAGSMAAGWAAATALRNNDSRKARAVLSIPSITIRQRRMERRQQGLYVSIPSAWSEKVEAGFPQDHGRWKARSGNRFDEQRLPTTEELMTADERGLPMTKDESRELVYGMPYEEWRDKHQKEASAGQKAAFEKASQKH